VQADLDGGDDGVMIVGRGEVVVDAALTSRTLLRNPRFTTMTSMAWYSQLMSWQRC
jgi:hypothetical protein